MYALSGLRSKVRGAETAAGGFCLSVQPMRRVLDRQLGSQPAGREMAGYDATDQY